MYQNLAGKRQIWEDEGGFWDLCDEFLRLEKEETVVEW